MNILGIGSHPDDLEIFCGGTLAKYSKRGDKVFMAIATDGRIGSETLPPKKIVSVRKKEAQESAKVIGAELIWHGFEDQAFFDSSETRLAIIDTIRKVNPDVIFTHYFPDYFSADHNNVGFTVNAASMMATPPNIKTKNKNISHNPPVYFFETAAGLGFNPDEYVDITNTLKTKQEMISKHKSQNEWLEYHCGENLFDMSSIISRFRGLQVGVKHAEGFIRCKAWARPIIGNLLP